MTATWNQFIADTDDPTMFSAAWWALATQAINQRVWPGPSVPGVGQLYSIPFPPPTVAPTLTASPTGGKIGPLPDPTVAPGVFPSPDAGHLPAGTFTFCYTWLYSYLGSVVETLASPTGIATFSSGVTNAVNIVVPTTQYVKGAAGTLYVPYIPVAAKIYVQISGTFRLAAFAPAISPSTLNGFSTASPITVPVNYLPAATAPVPPVSTGITVYARYTWNVNQSFDDANPPQLGGETSSSPEGSVFIASGKSHQITITVPAFPAQAATFKAYLSTLPSGETDQLAGFSTGTSVTIQDFSFYAGLPRPTYPVVNKTASNGMPIAGIQNLISANVTSLFMDLSTVGSGAANWTSEAAARTYAQLSSGTPMNIAYVSLAGTLSNPASFTINQPAITLPATMLDYPGFTVTFTVSGGVGIISDNSGGRGTYVNDGTSRSVAIGLLNFLVPRYPAFNFSLDEINQVWQVTIVEPTSSVHGLKFSTTGTGVTMIDPANGTYSVTSALWNRQASREVICPSDTRDLQGNLIAVGHKASIRGPYRVLARRVAPMANPVTPPQLLGSSTGGSLAAGTWWGCYAIWNGAGETLVSGESSVTLTDLPAKGTITVSGLVADGAHQLTISGTTSGGSYTRSFTFAVNGVLGPGGPASIVTLTETTSGLAVRFVQNTPADVAGNLFTLLGNFSSQFTATLNGTVINVQQVFAAASGNQVIVSLMPSIVTTGFTGGTTSQCSINFVLPHPQLPSGGLVWTLYIGTSQGNETLANTTPGGFGNAATRICVNNAMKARPSENWTNWSPDAGPADLLDSLNPVFGGSHVNPGLVKSQDYLHPRQLLEIRAMLNIMVRVWAFPALVVHSMVPADIDITLADVLQQGRIGIQTIVDIWIRQSTGSFSHPTIGPWQYYGSVGPLVLPNTFTLNASFFDPALVGVNAIVIFHYDCANGFNQTRNSF